MNTFDFTPLFRSSVGFDRLSRLLEKNMLADQDTAYPPYNIVKVSDDDYRITMAVAGFSDSDIDITSQENQLVVQGRAAKDREDGVTFLHRGIAGRAFERRFQLADHIPVFVGDQGEGVARALRASRAPDPMDIGVGGVGHVVIDDVRDAVDVETSGCDVGRDHDGEVARLEAMQGAFALSLGAVAVQAGDAEPGVRDLAGDLVGAVLCAREDQHRIAVDLFEQPDEQSRFQM